MRTWAFAKRTTKEILRDPINIIFGLGFPIVILLLLTTIQKKYSSHPFFTKTINTRNCSIWLVLLIIIFSYIDLS